MLIAALAVLGLIRTLDRVPTFEFDEQQARATRDAVEAFQQRTGTRLFVANAKLRKAPEYYE